MFRATGHHIFLHEIIIRSTIYWLGKSTPENFMQFLFVVFEEIKFEVSAVSFEIYLKHPKIKLQPLRKIRIWTFGSLIHQINSIYEVLKLEKIFQKNNVATGKTPLFVIGPFCSDHSVWLNIGFEQSSCEWKWCVFNLGGFH